METLDELLELEHAGWVALCNGTAADFYDTHMTDDGVMVLANGMVMDRASVVTALRDAPPWAGYEIVEPLLVDLAVGVAALVYGGIGRRNEGEPFVGAMTSVYVRQDDAWRLALYQQTRRT